MAMTMPHSEPIAGVLLAGGQSRRLGGGDKSLRLLAGKPLIQHAIERLAPQVSAMAINANGDPQRFAGFGLPVVADPVGDFPGPLAGILAGMRWAGSMHWIVTVACDTPFFPANLAAQLLAATGGRYPAISVASSAELAQPVFGLWPTALADDLETALAAGQRKVMGWASSHGAVLVDFPFIAAASGASTRFSTSIRPRT